MRNLAIVACAVVSVSGCAGALYSIDPHYQAATRNQAQQMRPLAAGQTLDGQAEHGYTHICHLLQTTRGQHWDITLAMEAGVLAITRAPHCDPSKTVGWFQSAATTEGANPTATLRFVAGGGQYAVVVANNTGKGDGTFRITAENVPAAPGYAQLLPGLRPRTDPPAGTASTVAAANATAERHAPGQVFRDCDSCPELVVLPAGSFVMGSPDFEEGHEPAEGPRHRVTIQRPFAMSQFEVTFAEYEVCVTEGSCDPIAAGDAGWGRGQRPVINVAYPAAQRYVAWLSDSTGEKYFLPSEAEWEYAARAGTNSAWNTGDAIITADANYLSAYGKTVPVGSYPPNALGLFDMHGNVGEWTQDCMDAGYLNAPQDGAAAAGGDCVSQRVVRGGAWHNLPKDIRSAARSVAQSNSVSASVGFRVTRSL